MSSKANYIPEQGDIVWMVLDPRVGHEQSGRRPVIVLSRKELAIHTNLAVVSPITTKVKGLPYEIILEGTETKGAILPIHIKSVDFNVRKAIFIEKAPTSIIAKTLRGIQNILS